MKSIDFFLFYGSTYTFLSVMRIGALAEKAGIGIRWRPFNVREIMVEMDNIPFAKKPVKARYMWRDIERRAARHGLPWKGTPVYPVDPELIATKVGVIAAAEGWCPEYTKATYEAWFLGGKAPGVGTNTEAILDGLGRNGADIVKRARGADTAAALAAETEAARALGIFGSPTFAVDGEIFWGDDRLDEAIEWRVSN